MEKAAKTKQAHLTKRNLFAELSDGMAALAEVRQDERALRKHAAKSLFDRARKHIGAVKGRLKPRNTSAQAKTLVSGQVSLRAHRSRAPRFR